MRKQYHGQMNEKMCNEMRNVLGKVETVIREQMNLNEHWVSENKQTGVKDGSHSIKKLIDYLRLFAEVNRELI